MSARLKQIIQLLKAESADVEQRVADLERRRAWLNEQLSAFEVAVADDASAGGGVHARRLRGTRLVPKIEEYLKQHPCSTAAEVAAALRANEKSTATILSKLVSDGKLTKERRGYSVPVRTGS